MHVCVNHRELGEACINSNDCVAGLYCNGGSCDSVKEICDCTSEFSECGRGKECTCPAPQLIGPNTKPACRDDNSKRAADRSTNDLKKQEPYYECFNSSGVKRAVGLTNAKLYRSVQDCLNKNTLEKDLSMTLRRYRTDGAGECCTSFLMLLAWSPLLNACAVIPYLMLSSFVTLRPMSCIYVHIMCDSYCNKGNVGSVFGCRILFFVSLLALEQSNPPASLFPAPAFPTPSLMVPIMVPLPAVSHRSVILMRSCLSLLLSPSRRK